MTPGAYCDGIQHVGISTDHLENTIHFYEDLGFQVILSTCVPEKNQHVAFLQLGNQGIAWILKKPTQLL